MAASKLEYLKKYMEGNDESKKKKVRKVKRVNKNSSVKIIDTNIDLKDVKGGSDSEDPTIDDIKEDAPEVAEIIDDRPLEMRSFKKTFQDVSSRRSRDSGSDDENVPRRRNRRDSSNEDSPPPRSSNARRDHSDESPPRRRNARRDSSDESPPRRRRKDSSDESPPRRKPSGKREKRRDSDESPPRRKKAGQSSKSSDIDSPPRRPRRPVNTDREVAACEVIDGPESISLRRKDKNEEEAAAKREQAEKEARRKANYDKWQAGLVQQQQKQSYMEDVIMEANKPLARAANDADLEERLKAEIRTDDPMLAFLKKKKASKAEPSRPRYNGPQPPPNRYNIWPGYRWDGVDRSNGFEAKLMAMKNDKMANEEQAYKWSIEDM